MYIDDAYIEVDTYCTPLVLDHLRDAGIINEAEKDLTDQPEPFVAVQTYSETFRIAPCESQLIEKPIRCSEIKARPPLSPFDTGKILTLRRGHGSGRPSQPEHERLVDGRTVDTEGQRTPELNAPQ